MGGGEALIVDTLGRVIKPAYQQRVTLHEAGHFLIAYLVGLLPRDYTLSALDAYKRYGVADNLCVLGLWLINAVYKAAGFEGADLAGLLQDSLNAALRNQASLSAAGYSA
jgi:hypothetical protein